MKRSDVLNMQADLFREADEFAKALVSASEDVLADRTPYMEKARKLAHIKLMTRYARMTVVQGILGSNGRFMGSGEK